MTTPLKIEAGKFYRTRDGLKVRVYAVDGREDRAIHGAILFDDCWVDSAWRTNGVGVKADNPGPEDPDYDIISEWIDKPIVDWSKMPAWANWVAMDHGGLWAWFSTRPVAPANHLNWIAVNGGNYGTIPTEFAPTFNGDWKDSLVGRAQ